MLKKISTSITVVSVIAAGAITATVAADTANVPKETNVQAVSSTPNVATASPVRTFSDVQASEWYAAAVGEAVKKNYVDGYEDGLFHPERNVTRAEFLKLIVIGLGIQVAVGSGADWYQQYAAAAVDKGFYKLEDFNGNDKYNQPITRQEMAKLLIRAVDPALKDEMDDKKLVYEAVKRGLIQGFPGGDLALDAATNRGQAVAVIERVLSAKQGTKLEVDKYALSTAEINWHGTNVFTMLPQYFPEKQIGNFDLSKFKWDSSDGNLHEEVVEYIAVDMADPNDPHRKEIEGLPFGSWQRNSDGRKTKVQQIQAPTNSYVTYSKVKDVLKGPYPKGLYTFEGGGVMTEELVPKEKAGKDQDSVEISIGTQETPTTLLYSKYTMGQAYIDWNTQHFNQPYFAGDFPDSGGTYYWIQAQVHPKGDMAPLNGKVMTLDYTPSLYYYVNYGPKLTNSVQVQRFFLNDGSNP
jgi:hypothetical protein